MTKTKSKKDEKLPFRAFRPDDPMENAMVRLNAKTGISFSKQIWRALDAWLPKQKEAGYSPKKEKR